MKKRRIDRQQDLFLSILRPFVYVWMKMDAKRRIHMSPELSFKRMEPFIMLANHTFLFDVIHVPLRFKNVPYIVASQTLFTKQPTKFFVTQVAHVVPKSKGASDLKTVRELIGAVRRGYPILIFPEGDTTFYGETGQIEFSTMKLIKKLEIDVVTCKVKG
ncbi:MAG: 1-acyl-sn-glycerol-3-phosphate acyltransferase, partial [Acholeplasmataceae bacterium]|nr:1-acyl-sn-glycerol-3-phosphate acyltransferase [Acholeplasmataceae bacterium]